MLSAPWLSHYDAGVPPTLVPYAAGTILDRISDTARQRPDHPALLFKGARTSYAQLERLSDAFAAALVAEGIAPGDRVALVMPNCPQLVIAELGVWKAGAVAAPLNPLYSEHELEYALIECGAALVVVLTSFYQKIKGVQARTAVRRVIASNIKEGLPPHLRLLFTLFKEKKEGHRVDLQPGDLWMPDLLARHGRSGRPDVRVSPEAPALLLFTGGTTGTPKGAVGTHKALLTTAAQLHAWFSPIMADWNDVLLQVMPLFHVYGNAGVSMIAFYGHNTLALVPNPRDLNDVVATIKKVRPAFVPGVPTLFIALLNHPDVKAGRVDFKSIKLCISGAAPLLAETRERFEALTGGRMVEGYALTESMMGAVISPLKGTCPPGAVGLPLPDVELRIVDPAGAVLPAGQVGEILLRAPQMMQGYWNSPRETAVVLQDGWLRTGDLGYLDESGFMFIVDRTKDVIKPSGFQVWPREVEEAIASHAAVAEVSVAGVADPYQGEAVKAWVVLAKDANATAEEIRAHCRERLAAYKVPRYVEFRDALPKSTVGKVLRRMLRDEARATGTPASPSAR
jgi:long-chain acyl-CoA synthetase